MKATQLIEQLQALVAEHGDLDMLHFDECEMVFAHKLASTVEHFRGYVHPDEEFKDYPFYWDDRDVPVQGFAFT